MLSELHHLSLKLWGKQYNKIFVLHLIVVPQLKSGWQHKYSTKTRQAVPMNILRILLCLWFKLPVLLTLANRNISIFLLCPRWPRLVRRPFLRTTEHLKKTKISNKNNSAMIFPVSISLLSQQLAISVWRPTVLCLPFKLALH